MNAKRLQTIGITLFACSFVALLLHFVARNADRSATDKLSAQLDALTAHVDGVSGQPDEIASVSQTLSDASRSLDAIRRSHASLGSVRNLSFYAYAGLIFAGSGFIIAGARRRQ